MTTANFWESLLCQNSRPDYMTTAYFVTHLSKFENLETWLHDYTNFWESVASSIQTTWIASMTTVPFPKYPLSLEVLIFQCDYTQYLRVSTHQKYRTWLHDYSQYFHASIQIWDLRGLTTWLQPLFERVYSVKIQDLTTWLQPIFSSIYPNLRF